MMTLLKTTALAALAAGGLALPLMGGYGAGRLALALAVGIPAVSGLIAVAGRLRVSAPLRVRIAGIAGRLPRLGGVAGYVAGVGLALFPLLLNNYYLDTLGLAALYAMLAVGLNVTVGLTGLLDLGYAAFYGIGAYFYAVASTRAGVPFWLGLPLGGMLAALFGVALGVVTLRLRGDYLAIVTLGFVQITYLVFNNWDSVTGGPNGILQIARPSLFGWTLRKPAHFYVLTLALLSGVVLMVRRLLHSQIGRAWIAIREDAVAAAAMGINVTWMKVFAFALGAGIAGLAGVVFAAKYAFVSPESFNFQESVRILSMVVLGGMGSLPGAMLGALLLTLLPEWLRALENYRMLLFGAVLVVMMIFRPQGLLSKRI